MTHEELLAKIKEKNPDAVLIHITPKAPDCQHEWNEDKEADMPTHCVKCGYSFQRYIFCDCP